MRWKLFILICLTMIIALAVIVQADSSIKITPIDNNIAVGEEASFEIKIINNEDIRQRYSIYSLQSGRGWNVDPRPLRDKIIDLGPKEEYTTKMVANVLEDLSPGIYYVGFTIESDLGERYSKSLKIYLSPEGPVDYKPSIKAEIDMSEKINPKDPVSIKVFMENKNPLNMKNLKIRIQSDMQEFTKELAIELPSLERKIVEFTVIPNPYQQPNDHILFFVFEYEGEQVKLMEKKVEIKTLLTPFITKSSKENIYLKSFNSLTIKNEGNTINTQKVDIPISFWKSLFVSGEESVQKIDGVRSLVWNIELRPNEEITVHYIVNYRILAYLIFIVLIVLFFYWYVQTPLSLQKEAIISKIDDEGAISEIKIKLEVKNKTKKPIKNIQIIDIVPGIANVEKSLELGTLKPKEIKHTKKGTKVIWSLAEVDGLEHRLITYKIRAKLNIVGTFNLPRAIVEFNKKNGKKNKAYSNQFRLNS